MANTFGFHYVKSGYGLWLPGDDRGSWSEAWDEQIGYFEPHTLHPGDPVRLRMAQERMKNPPVRLTPAMIAAVELALARCAAESPWRIVAASIESTHLHLLITNSELDIDRTLKWVAQEMTKVIHQQTDHAGPVFCKGNWCSYIFDEQTWRTTRAYIERHNVRRGVGAQPYAFTRPV